MMRVPENLKGISLVIILLAVTLVAPSASARPGFWFGAGGAQQTAGGDLDGAQSHVHLDSTQTHADVPGKLDTGTGTALDIGYGINEYVGAEALYAATRHNASSPYVTPKLDTKATVLSIMGGLRFTLPSRNKRAELFARTLLGVYAVGYDDYALTGSVSGNQFAYTAKDTAAFAGAGGALGIGAELFFGNFGLSLGYTYSAAHFDTVSSSSNSGNSNSTATLSKSLNVPITTIDLLLTYHVPVQP